MSEVMIAGAILFASIFGALVIFPLMIGIVAVASNLSDAIYAKAIDKQNEKFWKKKELIRERALTEKQTITQVKTKLYPEYRYAVVNADNDKPLWVFEHEYEAREIARLTSQTVYILDLRGVKNEQVW
jgi:hypothetical protein